mmetsp:Transcript_3862/g.5710  ORF Transcript_3862/g.5710 Transcript_3862/m.5710 type:complete len:82 (-) Transcript_3862:2108-2353(-)
MGVVEKHVRMTIHTFDESIMKCRTLEICRSATRIENSLSYSKYGCEISSKFNARIQFPFLKKETQKSWLLALSFYSVAASH